MGRVLYWFAYLVGIVWGGGKRRGLPDVSREDFLRTWEESESAREVADKLGLPKAIVFARVARYRAQGHTLKEM